MLSFPNHQQKVATKSCGPICLQNIYENFAINKNLDDIFKELGVMETEPTFLSQLAINCKENGLNTTLFSSNPYIMAPNWTEVSSSEILINLKKWIVLNTNDPWVKSAIYWTYYLENHGDTLVSNISERLIDKCLDEGKIILTCVNDSWLWGKRKLDNVIEYDDIKGKGRGHFIVIYGKNENKYLICLIV
jgi:hypothetical protein